MGWQVTIMGGEDKYIYGELVEQHGGNKLLGRTKLRGEDNNNKTDVTER
jgi:hypothetical protein